MVNEMCLGDWDKWLVDYIIPGQEYTNRFFQGTLSV